MEERKTRLGSYSTFRDSAIKRLGPIPVKYRERIADRKAEECCRDMTCFPEELDRDAVQWFCQRRFRQIALKLGQTTFEKFEKSKHDMIFCFMLQMIERGQMI